jgi:hypothetical protein
MSRPVLIKPTCPLTSEGYNLKIVRRLLNINRFRVRLRKWSLRMQEGCPNDVDSSSILLINKVNIRFIIRELVPTLSEFKGGYSLCRRCWNGRFFRLVLGD